MDVCTHIQSALVGALGWLTASGQPKSLSRRGDIETKISVWGLIRRVRCLYLHMSRSRQQPAPFTTRLVTGYLGIGPIGPPVPVSVSGDCDHSCRCPPLLPLYFQSLLTSPILSCPCPSLPRPHFSSALSPALIPLPAHALSTSPPSCHPDRPLSALPAPI